MNESTRKLLEVDPNLKVKQRRWKRPRSNWDKAAGVECPNCHREVFRIIDGVCPSCNNSMLIQSEYRQQLLNGKKLNEDDFQALWNDKHQDLLNKLDEIKDNLRLEYHHRLDVKRWVVFRIENDYRCLVSGDTKCPCQDPVSLGCPLFECKQE